jgi:hypothetical protein
MFLSYLYSYFDLLIHFAQEYLDNASMTSNYVRQFIFSDILDPG